jgi:tetratricopeptide (TPR) repeat protein
MHNHQPYAGAVLLVGRSAELRELDHLLDQAAAGSGGLLTIVGAPGAGKTVLLAAAAANARRRGFEVLAAAPIPGRPGRLVWAQLLRESGASEGATSAFLAREAALEMSPEVGGLVASEPRLIVIDDLDVGGHEALHVLTELAARLVASATAIAVTTKAPISVGSELVLSGLSADELATVVGEIGDEQQHAVWVASRGMPGAGRTLAGQLSDLPHGRDPLVHLALNAVPRTQFLQVDDDLVRLLERALTRVTDGDARARLLARLSRELLGDPQSAGRRRELMNEALMRARDGRDGRTIAEVHDARLHALWDAAGAEDRLATASEIEGLARTAGDDGLERKGMFWRFIALMELARVDEAEMALVGYERAAQAAGDAEGSVVALSRHAMLAALRGRFPAVLALAEQVEDEGRRVGLPDLDRLLAAVRGAVIREQGERGAAEEALETIYLVARLLPGHLYTSTSARILSQLGRRDEAAAELQRLLPQALVASGPRWLGAMTDLAVVAVDTNNESAAAILYEALLPYRERLVIWGGANATDGLVSHYLGLLAGSLGQPDQAVAHLEEAVRLEERMGALPALAHTLAALSDALRARDGDVKRVTDVRRRSVELARRLDLTVLLARLGASPDRWTLRRDGESWLLEAGEERARLSEARGLEYLRTLLAAPGRDVPALDLAAGGPGLAAPLPTPLLDAEAITTYRQRIAELDAELAAAGRAGDAARAERAEHERAALVAEVRRATGLGGRMRRTSTEAERARVNVTRTLRAALTRITAQAPKAGAHLEASIRTGLACRYDPISGGPNGWNV